ncbi:TIGR01440 family protein [Halalkalibacterium ligniniphilum]|uniref:TIGR01440 family protein n=1 Tax=Halalkalibacterium ligniniphilum TaxID=1134413 RepID=UPI000345FD72|nr:TIGR01440 family protein [Halalkalibacterium ligniniphilum]
MSDLIANIQQQVEAALKDLHSAKPLSTGDLLVVGASTSEVLGEHIGSNGSQEVAAAIYAALFSYKAKTGVHLAFQCCEHLNRALVMEWETARERGYEEVAVVPVRKAGGAMATYAYGKMVEPVVVESIKAEAGIDIGDTFIGMHLKQVAVPVRSTVRSVGHAHLTMAKTRPKFIGGTRAVYEKNKEHENCT